MSQRTPSASIRKSVSKIKENNLTRLWSTTNTPISPPKNSKPNFIIKWGPPASGKTQGLKSTIEQLGAPLNSYINFSVDDPIEAATYFRNTTLRIANGYFKNVNKNENSIVKKLNGITNKNAETFRRVYGDVRKTRNNNGRTFGNKLNTMILAAMERRINITFETTGSSDNVWGVPAWPGWLWAKFPELSSVYNVIILFPMVPFETTWDRYRRRAAQMYLKRDGFRFAASKRQLFNLYFTSYVNFTRNMSSIAKMDKVSRVIVVPHKGSPLEWKPGAMASKGRAGLRTRNRQVMLDLVNKYIAHITNRNFSI